MWSLKADRKSYLKIQTKSSQQHNIFTEQLSEPWNLFWKLKTGDLGIQLQKLFFRAVSKFVIFGETSHQAMQTSSRKGTLGLTSAALCSPFPLVPVIIVTRLNNFCHKNISLSHFSWHDLIWYLSLAEFKSCNF